MHSNTENNENKQSESIRDYNVYEQLGKGGFATVYRCYFQLNKRMKLMLLSWEEE